MSLLSIVKLVPSSTTIAPALSTSCTFELRKVKLEVSGPPVRPFTTVNGVVTWRPPTSTSNPSTVTWFEQSAWNSLLFNGPTIVNQFVVLALLAPPEQVCQIPNSLEPAVTVSPLAV